jgi:cell fate regulator YaaT (PSP1 superfamily)
MNLEATKAKFYFSAEGRVDFRVLIKDLTQKFKMKIEMRQIGVRDEAKLMGGCGPCGLKLCCSGFLKDFEPVSIRMAKNQNLPLNPMKITGTCGRLLCCLIYENDAYKELKKNLPKNGIMVETPQGEGKVTSTDIIQQKVLVELEEGKRLSFTINEIKTIKKNVKNLKHENQQGKNDKPT